MFDGYLDSQVILSVGGTFSEIVESFHKMLVDVYPDLKWVMREATPPNNRDGWYRCEFNTVLKNKQYSYDAQFKLRVFSVHRNKDNTWDFEEE